MVSKPGTLHDWNSCWVSVMEQHPTLPLVTVSGIDKTVKLFSPLAKRPDPSFARTHLRDSIIKANTERADFEPASSFGRVSVLNFLASRGIRARFGGGGNDSDDDEDDRQPECTTQ